MKELKALVKKLNDLKIDQTCCWEEDIPNDLWEAHFNVNFKTVAKGLNIDKHRWYEVSTDVIEMMGGFLGIRHISKMYNENSDIEDFCHTLKFYVMEPYEVISYRIAEE